MSPRRCSSSVVNRRRPRGRCRRCLRRRGLSHAAEDTYAVNDYILSRDALSEMIQTQELKDVFNRPEADALSRFPIFGGMATFEHFFRHYLRHVDVTMDSTTGVSTLTVKTYRASDSARVAAALLTAGENLINRMNDRQRENAMRDARKEVAAAEARVTEVASKIAAFRNKEALLDPTRQSVPMLAAINDLQTLLSRTELQISQLTTSTPAEPTHTRPSPPCRCVAGANSKCPSDDNRDGRFSRSKDHSVRHAGIAAAICR